MSEEKKDDEQIGNYRLEYQEINMWLKHLEIAWWAVGTVLIPVTVGVMYKAISSLSFLFAGGLPIVIVWWIYMWFTKFVIRQELQFMKRLETIENFLKMESITKSKERLNNVTEEEIVQYFLNFEKDYRVIKIAKDLFKKMPSNFRFHDFMFGLCIAISILWVIILLGDIVGWIFAQICDSP